MEYNTSALCDIYIDQVDVVEPMFSNFGGRASFAGQITTVKCFEDNGLIRETLEQDGVGRVLLIDGGGSLRRALIDAELAALAGRKRVGRHRCLRLCPRSGRTGRYEHWYSSYGCNSSRRKQPRYW